MGNGKKTTRVCEGCGAVMYDVGAKRRLCPACVGRKAALAMRRQKALNIAKRKAEKPPATPPKPRPQKKIPDNSLRAVLVRADAAGRTYGQQVEFERRQKELMERVETET